MTVTMNAATFMEKNFQDNQNSIVNTSDLTVKKMFDISAKLVSEQDEIIKVDTILWEKHSWKNLSLIGDETIRLFRFCVVSWKGPSTCEVQRSLEGQDRMDHKGSKLQRP